MTETHWPRAVQVIECASWEAFKSDLRGEYSESLDGTTPLYRGHARPEWRLASPWERELVRGTRWPRDQQADGRRLAAILENFKDFSIGLPGIHGRDMPTDDDWWTLGRHYGLVTPLLDWSRSPYVAAFFAFTEFLETWSPGVKTGGSVNTPRIAKHGATARVAIWSFMLERLSEEPGTPEHLEVLQSRTDIGHRQRAQRGIFTRLKHESYLCLEDYFESLQPRVAPLRQYLVPGREAAAAITDLRMMNLSFGTLFPDLTGAALQANFDRLFFGLLAMSAFSEDVWDFLAKSETAREKE